MAFWDGWGAGPAGAGSRAPSKIFLGVALAVALFLAISLARERKGWEAGVTAVAAGYFALRLFGGLGGRRG